MSATRPHIPLVPPENWTEEVQAIFPIMVPPGAPVKGSDFNSILMFANHPSVAEGWLRFSLGVNNSQAVDIRIKEIATLRVGWQLRCHYEWIHHIASGLRIGLTMDHITAIQAGSSDPIWSPLEAHVLDLADQFCARRSIDPATWAGLSADFDHQQMLELYFVVAGYVALALMFNSADVQPETMFLDMAAANGWPTFPEDAEG